MVFVCFCRVFCFVSFAAGASFALVGSFRYFPNLEISGDSGSRCSLIKWRMPTFGLHWRLRSTWSTWSLATKMAWKTSCLWHMILKRLQKWLVSCPLAAWIPIKTNRFYPWDSFGSLLIIHDFTMFFLMHMKKTRWSRWLLWNQIRIDQPISYIFSRNESNMGYNYHHLCYISCVWPPRMTVANKGLIWDSLLNM